MKCTIVATVLLGLCLAPALGFVIGQQPGQQVFPGQNVFPGQDVYPGQQVFPGQDVYPGQQVFPGQDVFPRPNYPQNPNLNQQSTIIVGTQILTLNRQWRVAVIEKQNSLDSWKTIWDYRTGVIVTKVPAERVCYISTMNKQLVPTFDALPRLAEQNRLQGVKGQPSKDIIYVIKRPILNLQAYGQEVIAMCSGLTAYETYEVHGPQYTVDQGSCTKLNVLHLLDLAYCRANNKA